MKILYMRAQGERIKQYIDNTIKLFEDEYTEYYLSTTKKVFIYDIMSEDKVNPIKELVYYNYEQEILVWADDVAYFLSKRAIEEIEELIFALTEIDIQ